MVVMAVRPENAQPCIRAFRERRPVDPIRLDNSRERSFRIALHRLTQAREYLLKQGKLDALVQENLTGLESALLRMRDDFNSSKLIRDWHNGDLRLILPFLYRAAVRYATQPPLGGPLGVVFSELEATSFPENLLELYTPNFPKTHGHPQFVFLRLRIVAYLYKRRHEPWQAKDRLVVEFGENFGLEQRDVSRAIDAMHVSDNGTDGGGLLRIQDVGVDEETIGVVLLPAGEALIEMIATSVVFLSWVYGKQYSARGVGGPGLTRSQVRLNEAIEFVEARIVHYLKLEHPYMETGRGEGIGGAPTRKQHQRLVAYKDMFGYTTGHWFIGDLSVELQRFAANRPTLDRGGLDTLVEACSNYIENLSTFVATTPQPRAGSPRDMPRRSGR